MPRLVRAMLISLLVLALDLALPGSASAAPVLDQEQPTIDTSPGFVFGIGGAPDQQTAPLATPRGAGEPAGGGLFPRRPPAPPLPTPTGAGGEPDGTTLRHSP